MKSPKNQRKQKFMLMKFRFLPFYSSNFLCECVTTYGCMHISMCIHMLCRFAFSTCIMTEFIATGGCSLNSNTKGKTASFLWAQKWTRHLHMQTYSVTCIVYYNIKYPKEQWTRLGRKFSSLYSYTFYFALEKAFLQLSNNGERGWSVLSGSVLPDVYVIHEEVLLQ